MQVDDIEPLYILYADTIRDVQGANLEVILQALIKLLQAGYCRCTQKKWGKWRSCVGITVDRLRQRFARLSEDKRKCYPQYP